MDQKFLLYVFGDWDQHRKNTLEMRLQYINIWNLEAILRHRKCLPVYRGNVDLENDLEFFYASEHFIENLKLMCFWANNYCLIKHALYPMKMVDFRRLN